jgi:hypothetical protein
MAICPVAIGGAAAQDAAEAQAPRQRPARARWEAS